MLTASAHQALADGGRFSFSSCVWGAKEGQIVFLATMDFVWEAIWRWGVIGMPSTVDRYGQI